MPWNPEQYNKFQNERTAPFEDLLRMVAVRPNLHVVDLGCGTGELTRRLADILPESDVTGIDTSLEMLVKSDKYIRPGLHFSQGRLEEVVGDYDLIFSNAAVQWVVDHPTLIPNLLAHVRPGGQLAVQMPSNHNHPSHEFISEIAAQSPYREALNHYNRQWPVLSIEAYANLLYDHGGRDLNVIEKVYPHVLENADAMAEWTSGTALVPYMERLSQVLRESFMHDYRKKLNEHFPTKPIFYGFRRILFVATKTALSSIP